MKKNRGISLVDLLVVISVFGVLLAVSVPFVKTKLKEHEQAKSEVSEILEPKMSPITTSENEYEKVQEMILKQGNISKTYRLSSLKSGSTPVYSCISYPENLVRDAVPVNNEYCLILFNMAEKK